MHALLAGARRWPASSPVTFLASIVTKNFVPSGAGEWAVEGPVMLKAAQALGVPFGKVTMAVAYGNMLGNMIQPFWSLPLLGLMGLRARDIMGYCLVLFVVCLPVLALALSVLGTRQPRSANAMGGAPATSGKRSQTASGTASPRMIVRQTLRPATRPLLSPRPAPGAPVPRSGAWYE